MTHLTRRGFIAAGVAASAAMQWPGSTLAATAARDLRAHSRVLDIGGKAATVWGLGEANGSGLVFASGERFRVNLTNDLPEPTLIHWHGQIPPNDQDGVPDMPMPKLQPGETRSYDYALTPGTYWMHAHIPLQEMRLLAAPLIVRNAQDEQTDRQDVTMFLHDFSFKTPEEVMDQITGGHDDSAAGMGGHGTMSHATMPAGTMAMTGSSAMPKDQGGMSMGAMSGMQMDLNDYDWDAYLTNDRTLWDPDVILVDRGGRVRVRVINAAAATVFWIDTGAVTARLVAVDGHPVTPMTGTRFGIAMGQRLDLELDLQGDGAWPILALREGARERTGLVLATAGAAVPKLSSLAEQDAPPFDIDFGQESNLRAVQSLPSQPVQSRQMIMLSGAMQPYQWMINGKTWGDHVPVRATSGDRVELVFHNMSMMGHPMHLHGHVFQVVEVNGKRFAGARRDTVYVPPMSMVTVALTAGEAARWMLHCHHMPHLEMGMMTEFSVSA